MCLFVIKKVGQRKTLSSRRKIWLSFSGKCFPFIFGGKHFLEVMKKLEKSYYLLIISNLILKLLIDIYFVFNFFFQFHHLELIFILILVLIFIIVICFFLIIFLIEIFNLSNLVLILLIVTYFI
jgi:hypothetical protein